jgi:hypothetical protein
VVDDPKTYAISIADDLFFDTHRKPMDKGIRAGYRKDES